MRDRRAVTEGTIEEQTCIVLDAIRDTLAEAGCGLEDVVKAMVWLTDRADFPRLQCRLCRVLPSRSPGPHGRR